MAKDQTRRLSPAVRAEDLDTLERLKTIANYKPANPALTKEACETVVNDMHTAQGDEEQTAALLDQKRALAIEREWARHNTAVAVRDAIEVQFGKNSVEVQMIGRKTEDQRKRPTRKQKPEGK